MNQHKSELKYCERCNLNFNARISDLKRGFGRFCSFRCRNQRSGEKFHSHPLECAKQRPSKTSEQI